MSKKAKIKKLKQENQILRKAVSEDNRANRLEYLYKTAKQDLDEADFCIDYLLGKARDWEEVARVLAMEIGNPGNADSLYKDVRDGLYDKVYGRIETSFDTYGHSHEDKKALWDRNVEEVVLLRQMLTHSIYCPRQACLYCSEIEKEVRNGR